jgi:hypothetical protein
MNPITAGTKVICPRQHHHIGTINRDIPDGEPIMYARIDFEEGQSVIAGQPPLCTICQSQYLRGRNMVYTPNGWLPYEPTDIEPVK